MRRVTPTVALIATALLAFAPPSTSGAEPNRRAAPKKCLWKKRDCYPPARLWYRVSASLEAEQNTSLDRPPTDASEHHRLTERWTLRSNHAIRLTLLCDDPALAEPFLAKRRIDGKRRTIGGCANPRERRMRPSLRFAATAGGEVTSMVRSQTFGPTEVIHPGGGFRRCEGREVSNTLVSSQPLAGTISTRDSTGIGLLIDAPASAPFATTHSVRTAFTCEENGTVTSSPRVEFDLRFGHTDVIGGDPREGIFDAGEWVALYNRLLFSARATDFGGALTFHKKVTQPELKPGAFPPPPPELGGAFTAAKDYSFTVRFEPCPDKGRDVQGC